MSKDYENWTLVQLKDELKRRKARCGGRKQDLVARLQSLDILYGPEDNMEEEYCMDVPEISCYNDVHAGSTVPPITMDLLNTFMSNNDKQFDKKCRLFYEQRYIRFVRACYRDGITYITGSIWAEMKKSVSYKVDLAVDKHGVLTETQCECSAGQGPTAHCKHVASLAYALIRLQTDGQLITDTTCTQKLQTFHRPNKPHAGSPIKSTAMVRTSAAGKRQLVYDPRPDSFRHRSDYLGHFRTTILNFPKFGEMPVAQLFEPADPYAVNAMHDYCQSSEDFFLQSSNITTISAADRLHLEFATRGQASNKIWLEERTKRITASHFADVCTATAKKDMNLLARNLTTPRHFDSRSVAHGRLYEQAAVKKFEEVMGSEAIECGLIVHMEFPFLAASPDRLFGNDAVVEIKCPYTARNFKINSVTVPYLKPCGDQLRLDRNHPYYFQVQGQLACSDRNVCYFCVFTFVDFVLIKLDKDDEFITEMMDKLHAFYHTFFKPKLLEKYVYHFYNEHF